MQRTVSLIGMEYIKVTRLREFDIRIAAIHGLGGAEEEVMDLRHEEFMAMADAFLGPGFDPIKLARVESLQLALRDAQAALSKTLQAQQIDRIRYFEEVSKVHGSIAKQCEAILGPANFIKLFGVTPREIGANIDMEAFLAQS